MWGWIITAVLIAVAGIAWLQHRSQAGIYRPLASRQPPRPKPGKRPLGTEALDLDEVHRTQRVNESLERAHTNWNRGRGHIMGAESAETNVTPLADDETYAQRFHAAFMKDKD